MVWDSFLLCMVAFKLMWPPCQCEPIWRIAWICRCNKVASECTCICIQSSISSKQCLHVKPCCMKITWDIKFIMFSLLSFAALLRSDLQHISGIREYVYVPLAFASLLCVSRMLSTCPLNHPFHFFIINTFHKHSILLWLLCMFRAYTPSPNDIELIPFSSNSPYPNHTSLWSSADKFSR